MSELLKLQPASLWKYFQEICTIPRPSQKEAKAIEYVIKFAKAHKLSYKKDNIGNTLISKPASKGMEKCPTVVLQAHLDMVPQKNSDIVHDFEKDPIRPYIDDDWVKAKGTTLGADNGIGIAAILAVLESDKIVSGPIEALFTVEEETGLTGVFNLSPDFITGKILLNLDSEEEGELVIGCAGGMNTTATYDYKKIQIKGDVIAFKLSVTGLKGGHSGADINLGRGNANKLLNRFVWNASYFFDTKLCTFNGGDLRNAIPREAFAIVTIPKIYKNDFTESVASFLKMYKDEFADVEPDLNFKAEPIAVPEFWIEKNVQENLLDSIYALPNGVIRMISEMPEVVETSTNLAAIKTTDTQIEVMCLLRSSIDSAKKDLGNMIESIFDMAHAKTVHDSDYPGWKSDFNSSLLNVMKKTYKGLYGKKPEVKVIHAGLECGIISDIYPGIEMVSFGPTILHPHSPDEKVNIPSVEKFWKYLVETLKEITTISKKA